MFCVNDWRMIQYLPHSDPLLTGVPAPPALSKSLWIEYFQLPPGWVTAPGEKILLRLTLLKVKAGLTSRSHLNVLVGLSNTTPFYQLPKNRQALLVNITPFENWWNLIQIRWNNLLLSVTYSESQIQALYPPGTSPVPFFAPLIPHHHSRLLMREHSPPHHRKNDRKKEILFLRRLY